jgi:hypothetical protein
LIKIRNVPVFTNYISIAGNGFAGNKDDAGKKSKQKIFHNKYFDG